MLLAISLESINSVYYYSYYSYSTHDHILPDLLSGLNEYGEQISKIPFESENSDSYVTVLPEGRFLNFDKIFTDFDAVYYGNLGFENQGLIDLFREREYVCFDNTIFKSKSALLNFLLISSSVDLSLYMLKADCVSTTTTNNDISLNGNHYSHADGSKVTVKPDSREYTVVSSRIVHVGTSTLGVVYSLIDDDNKVLECPHDLITKV